MPPRRRDRRQPSSSAAAPPPEREAAAPRIVGPAAPPPPPEKSLVFSAVRFAVVLAALLAVSYYHRQKSAGGGGPSTLTVRERGLVKSEVSYSEILREHSRASTNTTCRNFQNHVLAYVTPWNSLGYDMAEKYGAKLTHVSPVWYELKSEANSEKKFVLEGRHNADLGWVSRVRANGKSLVLPRVVLPGVPWEYLQKSSQRKKVINVIADECKEMGYDGVVLESWSVWAAYGRLHDAEFRSKALNFVKQLGQALHSLNSKANPSHHLELIYVIPAPRGQEFNENDFAPDDLQVLRDFVDGFSLMTYDFSGPQSPGPNAPLLWVQSCLRLFLGDDVVNAGDLARKIFLGINFYGNDFIISEDLGGGPIIGRNFISLLEKHKPIIKWEERSSEHFFIYSEKKIKHAVFYPSLMSISRRLEEAQAVGASISIWEIGQGLEYFFDLL